jgi:hypothetical protein
MKYVYISTNKTIMYNFLVMHTCPYVIPGQPVIMTEFMVSDAISISRCQNEPKTEGYTESSDF